MQVPRHPGTEGRGTRPEPIRVPRQTLQFATGAAFGAAEAQAQQDMARAMFDVSDTLANMHEARSRREAQEAATAVERRAQAILHGDPDDPSRPGFLSLRGEQAVTAAGTVRESIAQAHSDAGANLHGRARELYDGLTVDVITNADRRMAVHIARQNEIAEDMAADATRAAAADSAIADPHDAILRNRALAVITDTTAAEAIRKGLPAEVAERLLHERTGALHAGSIDRLLSERDYSGAQSYFDEYQNAIPGELHGGIVESIRRTRERDVASLRHRVADHLDVFQIGNVPAGYQQTRAELEAIGGDAAAQLITRLDEAAADQIAVQQFNQMPVAEQADTLRELQPQVTTGSQARRLNLFQQNHALNVREIAAGRGLELAARHGVIDELEPVAFSDPMTLRARAEQAAAVAEHYGAPIGPFTVAEVAALEKTLTEAPAEIATATLASLRRGLGLDGATAVAGELTKGKRPELGPALLLIEDDPRLSEDIILGARLRRQTGSDLELTAAQRRAEIERVVGNLFEDSDADALAAFTAAADGLYAARRVPTGDLTFDASTYEEALRDVMGNPITFNGRTVLPPVPGMDELGFRRTVRAMEQADLIEFGNGVPLLDDDNPFTIDMFDARWGGLRSGDAQLVTSGPGRYMVFLPGLGFVRTQDNQPYEIDLRAKIENRPTDLRPVTAPPAIEPDPAPAATEPDPAPAEPDEPERPRPTGRLRRIPEGGR